MSKSIENAEKKRYSIVQAALELFLQHGYGVTSMENVASEAGVTKQTVYRYFPSKETLFVAVMERIRAEESQPYRFGSDSLQIELENFGRDLLAFHLTPSALGVYRLMLTEGGEEKLLEPFMNAGPKRVMQPLLAFLQQRCAGHDDLLFQAQMFTSMILVPRNQRLMNSHTRLTKAEQKEHVDKVVRMFLKTLNN